MSSLALDRIRRCLAMVPLIRARPGIRLGELASMFGVAESEVRADITDVLTNTLGGLVGLLLARGSVALVRAVRARVSP